MVKPFRDTWEMRRTAAAYSSSSSSSSSSISSRCDCNCSSTKVAAVATFFRTRLAFLFATVLSVAMGIAKTHGFHGLVNGINILFDDQGTRSGHIAAHVCSVTLMHKVLVAL